MRWHSSKISGPSHHMSSIVPQIIVIISHIDNLEQIVLIITINISDNGIVRNVLNTSDTIFMFNNLITWGVSNTKLMRYGHK